MAQPDRRCRGTTWVQPCRAAAPDENGFRAHHYRRDVVSVDHLDDARRIVDRLADFIEQNVQGAQVYREAWWLHDAADGRGLGGAGGGAAAFVYGSLA